MVPNPDWPQFGYLPSHVGFTPAEGTLGRDTLDAVERQWIASTGAAIAGSPVVADGVVYVGSQDRKLYAFPARCGQHGSSCSPIWYALLGDQIMGAPAVANGFVYVGSSDGKVSAFAIGCNNGGGACSPVWTAATGGAVWSGVSYSGGVIYAGSEDGYVYAYAEGCGSGGAVCGPAWRGHTGGAVDSVPAYANGVVYVSSEDGKLYAFDAACTGTCSPTWISAPSASAYFGSPTVDVVTGRVFAATQAGYVYGFAVGCGTGGATCSPVWQAQAGTQVNSTPAIAGGVLYVGSEDGYVYAFDPAGSTDCSGSGPVVCTPEWKGVTGGGVMSLPAVANGLVFVSSRDHTIDIFPVGCATSGGSCGPIWSGSTGAEVTSSIAVVNGYFYVGSYNGRLYAYGISDDWPQSRVDGHNSGVNRGERTISRSNIYGLRPAWTADTGDEVNQPPAVSDGVVYVTDHSGYVMAYPAACGTGGSGCSLLWKGYIGAAYQSAPTVANGKVFVGSDDHKLYAFNAGCGSGGATCPAAFTITVGAAIHAAPTVADGVVYFGSNDNNLYAYSISTCAAGPCSPLWYATATDFFWTTPTVADGVVYAGSKDGYVYAYKNCGTSGSLCSPQWKANTGNWITGAAAVSGGVVYVGSLSHKVYAFQVGCSDSGGTCTPIWTGDTNGSVYGSPSVVNGEVYVTSWSGSVFAFHVGCATGGDPCTPDWYANTGAGISAAPAVANGIVYAQTSNGYIYAYAVGCSAAGGSCDPIWSTDDGLTTGGGAPVVAEGKLFVGSSDHNLYAYSLEGGYYGATTYHPVNNARVLDTRPTGSGHTHMGAITGPLTAGTVYPFNVAGAPYVGGSGPAVPPGAVAITGNLTVTGQTAAGLVALGPQMTARGMPTTLNFVVGDNRANNITMGLAQDGSLSAVYRSATVGATVHLILDVTGYFTADDTGATYHSLTPGRVLDSRATGSGHTNIGLKGKFANKTVRTFSVAGVKGIGWASALVPSSATAVTGNLTVTNATSLGYASVGPTMVSVPSTSTLNVKAGTNRANGVTVKLKSGKLQAVWVGTNGSSADLIFDVTGYFTADLTGVRYHPIVPSRALDTYQSWGLIGSFQNRVPRTLVVGGWEEVPWDATGISGTLTVAGPSSGGYAFISPDVVASPTSSTVNTVTGVDSANGMDVPLRAGRVALIWCGTASSYTDLELDVTGYWK